MYFNKSTYAFTITTLLNKNTLLLKEQQSCFIFRRLQISSATENMLRKPRKVYINTKIIIKEKNKKQKTIILTNFQLLGVILENFSMRLTFQVFWYDRLSIAACSRRVPQSDQCFHTNIPMLHKSVPSIRWVLMTQTRFWRAQQTKLCIL